MSTEIRKRRREKEVKKWTEAEIKAVLSYMQNHRNVEKPTAKIYYSKLLAATKIEATWNILKCKIRYLKSQMKSADHWLNSTGAGVEDGVVERTVMDKVLKSCPHYKQLADIFATEREAEVVVMSSSAMELDSIENVVDDLEDPEPEAQEENDISVLASASSAASPIVKKIKPKHQNTAIDKLATLEAERMRFREKQLQFEIEKFNWMKQVEANKHENEKKKIENDFQKPLQFEIEKFNWMKQVEANKHENEKKKIENDFQLKKMELEQNERIRKLEIEMKYKNNNINNQ
ncbi:uncharacterized protein LOC126754058 [Bactrocera neohumeralis]|uniref:uncharacterized protein LOC126754058 n=1 Tax=Bactrocera neohumeralis TaxID=98809 RepID=UPI002166520A|nr:uncharacterized protein LOC126754058 [Bactrocera neohumeralis]